MTQELHTDKSPGDIIIDGQRTFRIGDDGKAYPYETEHRRVARERAARFQARISEPCPVAPRRAILSLFGRG